MPNKVSVPFHGQPGRTATPLNGERIDYFLYHLSAFPDTALALAYELGTLLEDTERQALWQQAQALLRLQYDESIASDERDLEIRQHYEHTLDKLVQSIPDNTDLWFCFGWWELLWKALDDVVAYKAISQPFMPYGAKMLRCEPGNPLMLARTLDPVGGFAHATKHQRQVVEKFIDDMLRGDDEEVVNDTCHGAKLGYRKYFQGEHHFRQTMVDLIQKAYHQQKKPPTQLRIAQLFIDRSTAHLLANPNPIDQLREWDLKVENMVRYIQARCKEFNLPWTKLLELAGIPSKKGSSTVNRGHEHHRSTRRLSICEGRPRCLGGVQRGGGT